MSDNRNVDIWIAGAFAAFTVDLIVYPLDTIKTRLQSPVSRLGSQMAMCEQGFTWRSCYSRLIYGPASSQL